MSNRDPYTDEEIAYLRLCATGAERPVCGPKGMSSGLTTRWIATLDARLAALRADRDALAALLVEAARYARRMPFDVAKRINAALARIDAAGGGK